MNEIIVGVDGSAPSLAAAEWAAREAVLRGHGLRIVLAIAPWVGDMPVDPRIGAVRPQLHEGGQAVLDKATDRVANAAPGLRSCTELVIGGPAKTLLDCAKDAVMLVVGGHGSGEVIELLTGSVTTQVTTHAPCPVAVVRGPQAPPYGEIVVAVDGGSSVRRVLAFAFAEASLRGARLRAVHAWTHPAQAGPGDIAFPVHSSELVEEEEQRVLAEALAGWAAEYPDVETVQDVWAAEYPDVETVQDVVQGRTSRALTDASGRADLLVVGSRGRGGFAGLLLGSTSQTMLHRSRCPLIVVPDR